MEELNFSLEGLSRGMTNVFTFLSSDLCMTWKKNNADKALSSARKPGFANTFSTAVAV